MKNISLILLFLLLLFIDSIAQKEAYNWHFGNHAGFDFSSGKPELILNPMTPSLRSTSTMSDTNGNFLFTTNGENIWNRNNKIMLNGNELKGTAKASQGTLIVKKPGSNHLYYVFTTSNSSNGPESTPGLYYSVIDMTLDDGLGAVTETKNVLLTDAWDASEKIVACKQENSENIWIVTRKFKEDAFASFLLRPDGLDTEAVLSPAKSIQHNDVSGNMKVSPDKKYLVAAYNHITPLDEKDQVFEICSFNDITGEVGGFYTIRPGPPSKDERPTGVEFSPDSEMLYLSFYDNGPDHNVKLFQYETKYIEDSAQFLQSEIFIGSVPAYGILWLKTE